MIPSTREQKHDVPADHGGHQGGSKVLASHSWAVGVKGSAGGNRSPPIASEITLSIDTRTDPVSDLQLMGGDGQDERIRRDPRDNPASVLTLLGCRWRSI